jgi:hypothetical protein
LQINKKEMDKSYSFMSDAEPTKEQLEELMLSVLEDVKERAAKAEAKFKDLQAQDLKQALEAWQQKQKKQ